MRRPGIQSAAALSLLCAPSLYAATVTPGDPAAGGIGYTNQVALGNSDFASISGHVGAWSWEDEGVFTPGVDPTAGWTHTSNWVALTVTSDTWLTLSITRNAAVPYVGGGNIGGFADTASMFPSFTLWRNWDNDDSDNHTYANTGAVSWAEDLAYLDHTKNNSSPSAADTWFLPAGQYTLAIGSDAPSASNPPRQGYLAQFSTSAIPEPGSAVLVVAGTLGLIRRRRRV